MGNMVKALEKQKKRKEIKALKRIFLDERQLHERLISEGLMEKSNLVGHSVRRIDWDAQLAAAKKDVTKQISKKNVDDDMIDLEWAEEELEKVIDVDTSHLHGVK